MRKMASFAFVLATLGFVPASHAGAYLSDNEAFGSVCGASCLAAHSESALQLELEYTQMYAHDPARPPLVIVNHPPADGGTVSARY